MKIKRFEFLTNMIQTYGFKIGAEIGTGKGQTAGYLFRHNPDLHLIEVSHYTSFARKPGDYTQLGKELWQKKVRKYKRRMTVLPYTSREAINKVEDGSLDFVFIDADHSYKECLWDIIHWMPKVKKGGLVSGHDFQDRFPGVKKAVREVFGDKFETAEDSVWYVWKK